MQFSQRSQPLCTSTATRSPTRNSSTSGPRTATVPAYSWPMMNCPSGWPWSLRWSTFTSVPQIEATSTFRSTSPGPSSGTGQVCTRISSAPCRTTAFIVDGIDISSPPLEDSLRQPMVTGPHARHAHPWLSRCSHRSRYNLTPPSEAPQRRPWQPGQGRHDGAVEEVRRRFAPPLMSNVTRGKKEGTPVFDLDRFNADCGAAVSGRAGQQAIREILARAVEDPRSVLKALGEPNRAEVQTLHRSSDVTILNVIWG